LPDEGTVEPNHGSNDVIIMMVVMIELLNGGIGESDGKIIIIIIIGI